MVKSNTNIHARFLDPVILVVGVLALAGLAPGATAAVIDFEEPIAFPQDVRTQYCSDPATNRGVKFLTQGRIFSPSITTSSPPNALTNDIPGDEFGEQRKLDILFTAPQSEVSVKVGLVDQYPQSVIARMTAYSTDTPGTGVVTLDNLQLGVGPHEILTTLTVSSSANDIRSVRIEFVGPDAGAFEAIDDLTFSTVGPLCVNDGTNPTVQITEPAHSGQPVHGAYLRLAFDASDDQTGVAKVAVEYHNLSSGLIETTVLCPWTSGTPCTQPSDSSSPLHYDYYAEIPAGTDFIFAKAWDFTGRSGSDSRSIVFRPPGPDMNLWAMALEITQATQPWLPVNTERRRPGSTPPTFTYPYAPTAVPLVAKRTTVARLYGGVEDTAGGIPIDGARASLRCFTDVNYLTPCPGPIDIEPEHRPPDHYAEITLHPTEDLDSKRRLAGRSWEFVLPEPWTEEGRIYLEGLVMPPFGVSECDGCADAANRLRVSRVDFTGLPDFAADLVHLVRVDRWLDGNPESPTPPQIDAAIDFLWPRFPIDEATIHTQVDATWTYNDELHDPNVSGSLEKRCSRMINHLRKAFSGRAGKVAVYAIIDDQFPCAGLGGGGFAYGHLPDTFPHEVGHAVGLDHAGPPPGHGAECPPCDGDWPYPHGTTGAYGYDIMKEQIVRKDGLECRTPGVCDDGVDNDGDGRIDEECIGQLDPDPPADFMDSPHDFMSYGGCGVWVSPRTWIRIFNAFADTDHSYPKNDAAGAVATGTDGPDASSSYLLVTGERDASGVWSLHPTYETELEAGSHDDVGEGEYALELRDATGNLEFGRSCDIPEAHVDVGERGNTLILEPRFAEIIPLAPGVASVTLRHGTQVLATKTRTPHAPMVSILSPDAGGFSGSPAAPVILLDGWDADGDTLHYMIQYSPGPGSVADRDWQTLAADWPDDELGVDLDRLPGGAEAMVRVLATDGFNTAVAVSPAFAVTDSEPVARILLPSAGTVFRHGDRVSLRGAATDREEGGLSGADVAWSSLLDGPLGNGLRLDTSDLSVGIHEITLRAEDSGGNGGEDRVMVEVVERVRYQPVADAGGDVVAECNGPSTTPVTLDGSRSYDPDGGPLTFAWEASGVTLDSPSAAQTGGAFPMGSTPVTLAVFDGELSGSDSVTVTVEDTTPPAGSITWPTDGHCSGSPVTVLHDFSDPCDGELEVVFSPGPGPTYAEHGDYDVTVTARDDSGNTSTDTVAFAVDGTAPTVAWLGLPARIDVPSAIPFALIFDSSDDDGAGGDVLHEAVTLENEGRVCTIYDGSAYGDGDGLLSDEALMLTRQEICRVSRQCGFTVLVDPTVRVEASDCGGNVGAATHTFLGSLAANTRFCRGVSGK